MRSISCVSAVNPAALTSSVLTTTLEVTGDRSAKRRIARLSSLKLADSERSAPTQIQPRLVAKGLSESSRTVLPTPRSPVRIMFSSTVL